ncbi:ABC transporter substrate-binding protein [Anatilimnocola sp. NA78]|uniref:ABC transporter substrate-binding protein n=1 Tax=Anatilimnocola sp. NA78 TaxID=3415683 RepID=UPI003CE505AD
MQNASRYHSVHYSLLLAGCLAVGITAGCKQPPPAAPAAKTAPLRVIVVDDAPLAKTLAREWLAHTESQLDIVEVTTDKAAAAQQLPADVVIYPPGLIGSLAKADLLLPLDESLLNDPEYARDDISPLLRSQLTTWGRRTVAVPLGSPQMVLFYRADLLAQQKLQPPQTWEEYQKVVEAFRTKPADVAIDDKAWQATAEPLAAGSGGELLLARAASTAVHRDQLSPLMNLDSLEPLIAGPPFVRALEQLVAASPADAHLDKLLSPAACYAKFLAGECALAITWPMMLEQAPATMLKPEQIGLALLPGSQEMFNPTSQSWEPLAADDSAHAPFLSGNGRMASVSRASAQPRAATQFLLWLSGPKLSGRIASHSATTVPFRTSHLRNADAWQPPQPVAHLTQYGELLATAQDNPRRLVAPRIPGSGQYLAALDQAVIAAVSQEKSAADALASAADEWNKITAERGRTSQQRALRRSLGLSD